MTKVWAGRALIAAGFAVVVGCTAPTIGLEPGSTTNESDSSGDDDDSTTTSKKKHVQTSGDDDDDDDNTTTVPTGTTTVTATDAGAKADAAAPCTDSGAISFNGHCYFALTTSMSFTDAQTACAAANGAHLATLTSAAEESAASAIDSGNERWIGLRRQPGTAANDASYAWVTPEPRNGFSNWDQAKNEPDGSCPNCGNTGHDAECARELSNGAGWADDDCTATHQALCERD